MFEGVTLLKRAVVWLPALLLAACQTMPDRTSAPTFTLAQREALEREGFMQDGENYELGFENRVLFEFDRSDLKTETRIMLNRLGEVLRRVGIRGASVEGHTDSAGTEAYNLQLSRLRAEAVKQALVFAGMDERRTRSWGAGESDPIASNATEAGRSQNRRVVIVVTPADAARQ